MLTTPTIVFNAVAVAADATAAGSTTVDITYTGGIIAFQYTRVSGTGTPALKVEQSMGSDVGYVTVQTETLGASGIISLEIMSAPIMRLSLVGDGAAAATITGMLCEVQ